MRTWAKLSIVFTLAAAVYAEWQDGSYWGRGRFRPEKTNNAFATLHAFADGSIKVNGFRRQNSYDWTTS